MDEAKEKGDSVSIVKESSVTVTETVVETMVSEDQIQFAEKGEAGLTNGDDVMVEVSGSNVHVDGICTIYGEDGGVVQACSNDEALRDLDESGEVGSEGNLRTFVSECSAAGGLGGEAKVQIEVNGDVIGACSNDEAVCGRDQFGEVGLEGNPKSLDSEGDAAGALGSRNEDGDAKAQNDVNGTVSEGSGAHGSSALNAQQSSGIYKGEGDLNQATETRKVGDLDGNGLNHGNEKTVVCSSVVSEDPSVQSKDVEEAAMMIDEEDLNTLDGAHESISEPITKVVVVNVDATQITTEGVSNSEAKDPIYSCQPTESVVEGHGKVKEIDRQGTDSEQQQMEVKTPHLSTENRDSGEVERVGECLKPQTVIDGGQEVDSNTTEAMHVEKQVSDAKNVDFDAEVDVKVETMGVGINNRNADEVCEPLDRQTDVFIGSGEGEALKVDNSVSNQICDAAASDKVLQSSGNEDQLAKNAESEDDLSVGQDMNVEEQITDDKPDSLEQGGEMEVKEHVSDSEEPTNVDEHIVKQTDIKSASVVKAYQAKYQLPSEEEGGFAVSDFQLSEEKTLEVVECATPMDTDGEQIPETSKTRRSSYLKRKHNLKDVLYPSKKDRSLSELMSETFDSPESDIGSDRTANKPLSSSFGKKRKAVDSSEDSSLPKGSPTTPHFPKPSFKIGERIRRAASQMNGSPSIIKCSADRLQKVDGGYDFPDDNFEDPEPKRMDISTEYPSLDELFLQLRLAACDPMKSYNSLNIIISFFLDFRDSMVLDQLSDNKAGGKRKKSPNSIIGSSGSFEFEDRGDTYWTDRIVQNNSEEHPSLGTGRGEYQIVPVELEKPIQKVRKSRKRYSDVNHDLTAQKPPGYVDEKAPAEIVMNFSEINSVPSETKLNKMFKHFGPLKESETEVDRETSRARVVFRRSSDAEVAYNSAGKFNIFGQVAVTYQLNYTISESFKASLYAPTLAEENPFIASAPCGDHALVASTLGEETSLIAPRLGEEASFMISTLGEETLPVATSFHEEPSCIASTVGEDTSAIPTTLADGTSVVATTMDEETLPVTTTAGSETMAFATTIVDETFTVATNVGEQSSPVFTTTSEPTTTSAEQTSRIATLCPEIPSVPATVGEETRSIPTASGEETHSMSGCELFLLDASLFVDDDDVAEAYEQYRREEPEVNEQKDKDDSTAALAEGTPTIPRTLDEDTPYVPAAFSEETLAVLSQGTPTIPKPLCEETNTTATLGQETLIAPATSGEETPIPTTLGEETHSSPSALGEETRRISTNLDEETNSISTNLDEETNSISTNLDEEAPTIPATLGEESRSISTNLDEETRTDPMSLAEETPSIPGTLDEETPSVPAALSEDTPAIPLTFTEDTPTIPPSFSEVTPSVLVTLSPETQTIPTKKTTISGEEATTAPATLHEETQAIPTTLAVDTPTITPKQDEETPISPKTLDEKIPTSPINLTEESSTSPTTSGVEASTVLLTDSKETSDVPTEMETLPPAVAESMEPAT